ncbi:MAG: CaiB/BaiF CoA transferase family protein, partial [Gammaproteobacteria bacterium]
MSGPLAGIRVIDASQYVAGPYCGTILGSMGADVIKVERPGGDEFRGTGPVIEGVSYPFQMLNHNKKSIVVDLKREAGAQIISRLASKADIFLQSGRPRTMERLGLGYASLAKMNPKIIYCGISGFGQNGPYGNRGGVDIIAQAMGGLMGVTGEPGRPPVKVSYPLADFGASMWAAIGILGALWGRSVSGKGQEIDAALIDVPISWSIWEASRYFGLNEKPRPLGSSHRNVAPYRAMKCADGKYIAIGVASQAMWSRLCAVIGAPELEKDSRFLTLVSRTDNRDALEKILEERFLTRSSADWLDALDEAQIASGPVYQYE